MDNSRMSFASKAYSSRQQESVLEDPSEVDGYKQVAQKQIMIEVLGQYDIKEKQFEDMIMLRVFKKPDQTIKIELTSEINIFFLYVSEMSPKEFKEFAEEEGLSITAQEFPIWFEKVLKEEKNICRFEILPNRGELMIKQRLQFKEVKLAKISFEYPGQDRIKESIMYRFELMRKKKEQLNTVLFKTNNLMKVKNPSFLLNFQKIKKIQVFK